MSAFDLARLVHILSASILFGSGLAIAFFMLMGWRSGDAAGFRLTARHVVLADWIFTASAVLVQPVSGLVLAHLSGWPLTSGWLLASYGLYALIGACWLPVVWIQLDVRRELAGLADGAPVPGRIDRLMRLWFWLGWPAFAALIAIFWLMITRPG